MRILYVLHRAPEGIPGGTELHTLDLIENLGSEVEKCLFYPDDGRIWLKRVGSGAVESVPYDRSTSPFFEHDSPIERFFMEATEQWNIDLIHFQHFLNLPVSLAGIAARRAIPYVVTLHDYYFWCVNYNLLRKLRFCWFESDIAVCQRCLADLGIHAEPSMIAQHRQRMLAVLQSAAAIVCPSDYVARTLRIVCPEIRPTVVHVVEHGTPLIPVRSLQPRRPGPLRVGFLGAFAPSKGSHHFAAIASAFRNRTDIQFYAIGIHWKGPENPIWSIPNIRWLGTYARRDIKRILQEYAIDVILLLSPWAETFSYTLSEAILALTPVIATDLGALRERVSQYGVGFLVEAEDPVPRTMRLLEDLAWNPGLLEPFRVRCLDAAEELSTASAMAKRYAEVYRHAVGTTQGQPSAETPLAPGPGHDVGQFVRPS